MRTALYRFGTPRQDVGEKHVKNGDLTEAVNVYQRKTGVYAKRPGFDRTAQTHSGATASGVPTDLLSEEHGNMLQRNSSGQLWVNDSSSNVWNYAGRDHTTSMENNVILPQRYSSPQPFCCLVSGHVWAFAITTNAYDLTVIDAATGAVLTPRTSVTATNIVAGAAVYDGTNVWVFWVENQANGLVRAHKFVVATPTVAPTATTYYQFPASPTDVSAIRVQQIAAKYFDGSSVTGGGQVFVCAAGGEYTGGATYKRAAMHSVLNTATGAATASGGQTAATSVAYSGGSGGNNIGGLSIHENQNGSAATWYYMLAGVVDTDYTTTKIVQVNLTAADFTTFAFTTINTEASTSPVSLIHGSGIVYNTYQVIVVTWYNQAKIVYGTAQRGYDTVAFHVSGATVTSILWRTGATDSNPVWLASTLNVVGSNIYALAAYDDFGVSQSDFGSEALSIQRSFYLIKLTVGASGSASLIEYESQHANGDAPALWHKSTAVITYASTNIPIVRTPVSLVYNSQMVCVSAIKSSVTGYVDVALITITPSSSVGRCCIHDGRGVAPGNIPMIWSERESAHEVAPLIAPAWMRITGSVSTPQFDIAAAVYVITSSDGTSYRSAPFVLSTTIYGSQTLIAPVSTIATKGVRVDIEFYLGTGGIPKLQAVVPAVSAVALSFACPATAAGLIDGEILYTLGNEPSQTWPPQCTAAASWNDRLFLINGRDVWYSLEAERGIGPVFNEVLVANWLESRTSIRAAGVVDSNYLAFISDDSVGVITGRGPDGLGNGNYIFQTLNSRRGVAAGKGVVHGPAGLYFQDEKSGQLCVVGSDLVVHLIDQGQRDYTSIVIDGGTWDEERGLLFFHSTSNVIVLDYRQPRDTAPFGMGYKWTFAGSSTWYAACYDTNGLVVANSSAHLSRPGSNYDDDNVVGGSYQMQLTGAELQLADINGQFDVSMVQFLVSVFATTGITVKVFPGYASLTLSDSRVTSKSATLTATNAGDPKAIMHRPAYCARIPSVRWQLIEASGITNRSFEFEGIGFEFWTSDTMFTPSTTQVI